MRNLFLIILLFSCSSISQINTSNNIDGEKNKGYRSESISLTNQLRRFPGIQITGNGSNAKISIRGINSILNQQGPLFYINNSPVGNDYSLVYNMVDPNDIKTISVLKEPTELQRYGFRGSSGVIIIKLK
tara:strand:+ start:626 stop:1015 length:390 start_codon:yes stop_codon:yes gene_type:complete